MTKKTKKQVVLQLRSLHEAIGSDYFKVHAVDGQNFAPPKQQAKSVG